MVQELFRATKFALLSISVLIAGDGYAQVNSPVATEPSKPCVLLKNQNVLFGVAQQRGEQVIVRKEDGSEIQLDRKQVACWSTSLRGLYRFRADHRYSFTVRSHLDEAQWCARYELYDLAENELQAVFRIDPGNPTATRLTERIRRDRQRKTSVASATLPAVDGSSVQLATHLQPIGEAPNAGPRNAEPPNVPGLVALEESVDPGTLQHFARQIQPLLLNRCSNCHSTDSDRKWKLETPTRGSRASSRMTHANLAATMRFVDLSNPAGSELRRRAADGHAGSSATLGSRAIKATRALDNWLRTARSASVPMQQSQSSPAPSPNDQSVRQTTHVDAAQQPAGDDGQSKPSGITRLPVVNNPFDPELFNRRFHRD